MGVLGTHCEKYRIVKIFVVIVVLHGTRNSPRTVILSKMMPLATRGPKPRLGWLMLKSGTDTSDQIRFVYHSLK